MGIVCLMYVNVLESVCLSLNGFILITPQEVLGNSTRTPCKFLEKSLVPPHRFLRELQRSP
jgi:hypothetical protein